MLTDPCLPLILTILFFATFIRSAFGFGEALIAVPMLALMMPVEQAAPIAVLVSIVVSAIVLIQDHRHVHFNSVKPLVLFTLVGTPIGLLALIILPAGVVKTSLGGIIILFSTFCLLKRPTHRLTDDRHAWGFGLIAGILGGGYGTNGPPLVIYGTLRGWSPQHFRATLQGYFFPASLMVLTGYAVAGLWTIVVTRYFLLSLPVVVLAVLLGRATNRRLNPARFIVYVHLGLIAVGALLLSQPWLG